MKKTRTVKSFCIPFYIFFIFYTLYILLHLPYLLFSLPNIHSVMVNKLCCHLHKNSWKNTKVVLCKAASVNVLSTLWWETLQHEEVRNVLTILTCIQQWHCVSQFSASRHTGYNLIMMCSDSFKSVYLKSFFGKMFKDLGLLFKQNLTLLEVNTEEVFILENLITKYCHTL